MEVSDKSPLIRLENYTRHLKRSAILDDDRRNGRAARRAVRTDEDDVLLSPQAREVMEARRALHAVADMRMDKVAALQKSIRDGSFVIDPEQIAQGLIRESLINDLYIE